ncbi:MAG: hypothetical protein KGM42_11365 [Hyphomicrobiales bacterium]|nr:hypothetical protein [Hyphomicrobiales bacterium]
MIRKADICAAAAACALLAAPAAPAFAWEVIGGDSLPTFAQGLVPGGPASAPLAAPGASGLSAPLSASGFNPGYDYRIGQKYLVGVQTTTGFAATSGLLGLAPGFDASRTSMKFGYDMGRFKPFVMSSFTNVGPTFGMNSFAAGFSGAAPTAGAPFAARVSTVGAGFDYAVTNNLSFGVSVSASQTTYGWPR